MKRIAVLLLIGVVAIVSMIGLRRMGVIGDRPVYATANGAIDGYDPVSYFSEEGPLEGSEEHQIDWKGETWFFSSAENRRAFEAEPEKYAPQYGGYCAYGLSEGYLTETDPGAWTIVDGRLYLNFDANVMETWRHSKERRIPLADRHWASQ
jgi:YHS domain-containing protein